MSYPICQEGWLLPPFEKGGQGGFEGVLVLKYKPLLKDKARNLRKDQTDCESILWSRLRRKQVLGIQFYRQKPIGRFIVDFYAPAAKLVVEVDGAQHLDEHHTKKDRAREQYLNARGLKVLRFFDNEVTESIDAVMNVIYGAVENVKAHISGDRV